MATGREREEEQGRCVCHENPHPRLGARTSRTERFVPLQRRQASGIQCESERPEPVESELQDGYFTIERRWKKGDKVEVHFDMEPRVVKAHAKVEADRGRVAVERGPLVYCAGVARQ